MPKVLIIEDDPTIRTAVIRALTEKVVELGPPQVISGKP
jgi:DNA-binding response OmpR family regulator